MANHPKIVSESAEALSPIEETLKRPAQSPSAEVGVAPLAAPAAFPSDNRLSVARSVPAEDNGEGIGTRVARSAANDDRLAIGRILQSLQRRPPPTAHFVAALLALAWAGGGIVLAYLHWPDLRGLLAQESGPLVLAGLAASALVPIAFFFVLAHLVWRAQELRYIAHSMAGVAMRFVEPDEMARESIVTVGQAVRREVAAMGDGVERALARAAELEALVANEVATLERSYHANEVRIRALLENLAKERDNLTAQAEQVRTTIAAAQLDLSRDIASASDLIAARINENAQKITHALEERGEHITQALHRTRDSMLGVLTERGGDLLERLERVGDQTRHAITTVSDRLVSEEFAKIMNNLTGQMQQRLDAMAADFAQKSSSLVQMIETRAQRMSDALADTSSHLAETIFTRADEVNNTLKSVGDSLALDLRLRSDDVAAKIAQTGAEITDALDTCTNKATGSLRESAEKLVTAVGSRSDALEQSLNARLQAFEATFTQNGSALAEKIARESTMLGDLITRHLVEFDRTIKTYGGELVERLGQRTQDVGEAMRATLAGFDSKVGAKTSEIAAMLEQRLARFETGVDSRVQALNDALAARVADIAGTLAEGGRELIASLEKRVSEVTSGIDARIGRLEQFAQSINANSAEAERTLTALMTELNRTLKQNADDVQRMLVGLSAEVARNFTGKANEISAAVSQHAAELTRLLDDKSSGLVSALGSRSKELASDINRVADTLLLAIEAQRANFARTMMDNTEQFARLVKEASESAAGTVNHTLQELQRNAQEAIEQSRQTAAASVAEMLETNNMLRADTTTLFERLREANILLQEVLSGAHENMSMIENTLVKRVTEFVATMNELTERSGAASSQVDERIASFRAVTGKVLNDLSQLSTQFESHGRLLGETAAMIDRSNLQTRDAIAERRAALDALVAALDASAGELEQRLQSFSRMLNESLDGAAGRAREVARLIAESCMQSEQALSQQFEALRAVSAEERQRTSEALRGVYEQTMGETNAIFTQTVQRFSDTLEGMKRMAAEMQRELEATRAELRRGVFELPREAAESTAQMRRVIVEQIEALAELNRIVARHGRGLDGGESARRSAPEELVPVKSPAPPRVPGRPAAQGAAEVSEVLRPTARAGTGGSPAPRRADSPAPSPAQGNGRSGWLADLLQRASRAEEPEERSPRHAIESLDSLSVDIARLIDHDAAVELWDRYKRGERNVFTRRLYTLQGQKTFEEIRKKYHANREFKQTVDRYIAEFERLLEDAARDDRGQMLARTYLSSETGKVYTMLAHATGRLEE